MAENWWWLSFCDNDKPEGEKFLGACIVKGDGMVEAVKEAHQRGCNPGGEVAGMEADPPEVIDVVPEDYKNVLMSQKDVSALNEIMRKALT